MASDFNNSTEASALLLADSFAEQLTSSTLEINYSIKLKLKIVVYGKR